MSPERWRGADGVLRGLRALHGPNEQAGALASTGVVFAHGRAAAEFVLASGPPAMWLLTNQTPFAAERNWIRDRDGVHWWLVAIRATYDVDPRGRLTLLDEQAPPVLAPEYFGDPGRSSLRHDSDLLEVKPGTDILVHGSVVAPGARPAASVPVTLRLGSVDKRLVVHGERIYRDGVTGLTTTAPRPFVQQPLRYESAFGGGDFRDPDPSRWRFDQRNPAGRGFAVDAAEGEMHCEHKTPRPSSPAHGPRGSKLKSRQCE